VSEQMTIQWYRSCRIHKLWGENVMVSQNERARIIATWGKEPLYVVGTLVKCAVCLLIICGMAFVGTVTEPLKERTAQEAPSPQGRIMPARGLDTSHQARTESARPVIRTDDHPDEPTVTRPVAIETSCHGVC
jgi:hypothetical protein